MHGAVEVNRILQVFEWPYMAFHQTLSLPTANSSLLMGCDALSDFIAKSGNVVAVILTSPCCFVACL